MRVDPDLEGGNFQTDGSENGEHVLGGFCAPGHSRFC